MRLEVHDERNAWPGVGRGDVGTVQPMPTVIEWTEAGSWTVPDRPPIPFRNALRWEAAPDGAILRLAHLRRGAEVPVELVELAASADGIWASQWPHECGEDIYDARLTVRAHDLELRWIVRGPKKQTTLISTYT